MANKTFKSKSKGSKKEFGQRPKSGKGKMVDKNIPQDFRHLTSAGQPSLGSDNDWTWYAGDEAILRDSASVSFDTALGAPFNYGLNAGVSDEAPRVSGIMTLFVHPTVGASYDATSAINMASRNIYSYVRHANSGHSNYESPDLMMYLVSMAHAHAWIAQLMRLYGLVNTYWRKNRYTPKALINAQGFDYDDIVKHISDLRLFINNTINKIGSLCVPRSMPYFDRLRWLNAGVYTDKIGEKSQFYQFVLDRYYRFSATSESTGSSLTLEYLSEHTTGDEDTMNFSDIVDFTNYLLEPLLSDEDINIMSGDILKAFGEDGIIKIGSVSEDFKIEPEYNLEVLTQIQNSTLADIDTTSTAKVKVRQQNGYILYDPTVVIAGPHVDNKPFTLPYPDVQPKDVMVASRLMPVHVSDTTTDIINESENVMANIADKSNYGSDFIHTWRFSSLTDTGLMSFNISAANYSPLASIYLVVESSRYENHPLFPMYQITGATTAMFNGYIGGYDNVIVINREVVSNMHNAAMINLFNVPIMGKFSRK